MDVAISALLAIVALSALGAWGLVAGKTAERPVKVMMFVGYFWLLAFVQLSLAAGGYYFWQHFFDGKP